MVMVRVLATAVLNHSHEFDLKSSHDRPIRSPVSFQTSLVPHPMNTLLQHVCIDPWEATGFLLHPYSPHNNGVFFRVGAGHCGWSEPWSWWYWLYDSYNVVKSVSIQKVLCWRGTVYWTRPGWPSSSLQTHEAGTFRVLGSQCWNWRMGIKRKIS